MEVSGITRRKFTLSPAFTSLYQGRQPEWGPLGYVIYKRTYARLLENGHTEEFWQTLQRVVEGVFNLQKFHCHKHHIPWDSRKAQRNAQRMFELMWSFKFLPAGRGLWLMGTDFMYKHGSAGLNSCAFASTQDLEDYPTDAFTWAMEASMLGIGVGFDVRGADTLFLQSPTGLRQVVIEDSREGWVKSVEVLLRAYLQGEYLPEFDYSLIRPAGKRLKTFGGVSSGPQPLVDLHNNIRNLLENRAGESLTSGDIVDIFTYIAKCVVSGNVRRSAMIALGDPSDSEFMNLKGDPIKLQDNRWASNNSVIAEVGMDYSGVVPGIQLNGEPGVIWLESIRSYGRMKDGITNSDRRACGVNPCSEQSLEDRELCNLVETYPSRHATLEEYKETLKYAVMYGKSVTLIDTHWPRTNAVMRRNRRMGISQSGIVDAFVRHGMSTMKIWNDVGYNTLKKYDRKMSDYLCVRESIKLSSVKPSGTISLLPGVSPGIHYPHSEYYIRRVRFAENSNLLPVLRAAGYPMESDTYSDRTTVVSFPVKTPYFSRGKREVTMWQQLENAALYQKYWADNQVSITVHFTKDEALQIQDALEYFDDRLKCVSFLPYQDHGYQQPPYEEITEAQYQRMIEQISELDHSSLCGDGAEGEQFCTSESCLLS